VLVLILLIAIGGTSFFIPYKNLKAYFVLSAIILSAAFFFYDPPVTEDLYRYYQLFDNVKALSLKKYLAQEYNTQDWLINHMLNDYKESAWFFSATLFVLSRTGIREIMPFVFSLLTYIPMFMLVYHVCKDNKFSKLTACLCFVMILACIDFRLVSCLRNLSAYSIFAYTLYEDAIKKRKKIWCVFMYFIACGLHMSCLPLVLMRILAAFLKGRIKWVVVTALLFSEGLALLFATLIKSFLSGNILFVMLAEKIEIYLLERTDYNVNGAIFFCASLFVIALIYITVKREKIIPAIYQKYESAYLFIGAYTVGCIGQYDILFRNCELMAILLVPFIARFINRRMVLGYNGISVVAPQDKIRRDVVVAFCFIGLIVMSFIFYTLFSYIPMGNYLGF